MTPHEALQPHPTLPGVVVVHTHLITRPLIYAAMGLPTSRAALGALQRARSWAMEAGWKASGNEARLWREVGEALDGAITATIARSWVA